MIAVLAYIVMALSGAMVVWGLVTAALDKPPGRAQLLFAAGVEVVTVVQSVVAFVILAQGFRPVELATTIGYLIGIVMLIPVAWFWANVERTRFSEAPVAYLLSAFAGVIYVVATIMLARGTRTSRKVATVAILIELMGVLTVGTLSVLDPEAFPRATVWSIYGIGYGFVPLLLPILGLWWLWATRTRAA